MPKLDQSAPRSLDAAAFSPLSLPATPSDLERLQADAGDHNADAQYLLGALCEEGNSALGIEQDEDTAIRWYYLAAAKGHRDAQFSLAYRMHSQLLFEWPTPAYFSSAEVIRWYRAAAEQGHGEAAYQLYLEYLADLEPGDSEKAAHWLNVATSLGYAPSSDDGAEPANSADA